MTREKAWSRPNE